MQSRAVLSAISKTAARFLKLDRWPDSGPDRNESDTSGDSRAVEWNRPEMDLQRDPWCSE